MTTRKLFSDRLWQRASDAMNTEFYRGPYSSQLEATLTHAHTTSGHATSRQSSCRNAHLAMSANMTQEVTFITSMLACCGTGCQLNGQPNCTISDMMPRPIAFRPG